jgi:hypothetical protein
MALNPINDVIQGIGNTVNGIAGGSIAQPSLQLFGTNLPGTPLISMRDTFLDSLSQWTHTIPKRTQWLVFFDNFPSAISADMMQRFEPTVNSSAWNINLSKGVTTNAKSQLIIGCIFSTGFNIGSEELRHEAATIPNNRGFIPGIVLGDRAPFTNQQFSLRLRETNTSFTDSVIRPWVILGSHFGYVARNPDDPEEAIKDVKTNMTVIQFAPTKKGMSQIPRKTWRFYNCVPLNVSSRDYSYDPSTEGGEEFVTNWAYDKYEISSNIFLDPKSILDTINPIGF